MMQSKKAESLSMNVIIIAAIALLVLVILAVLLFQSGNRVTEGTACKGFGGECESDEGGTWVGPNGKTYIRNPALDGSCDAGVCYVPLGKVDQER